MRKLRYFYWLSQSFLKKHSWVILAAAVFGAVSFKQSANLIRLLPQPKPTKYIGMVSFDSNLSNLPPSIQNLISDGLTQFDESGAFIPNLAKDWQIIDDGKTYIFTLKDNLYWQDGSPVQAPEINYTFKDVEVSTPDASTIVFKLKEPFAPFPSIVSQPIFKRTQTPILQLFNRTNIIGTGDYRITKLNFNGNYLNQIILESSLERRVYRFYHTETAAIAAFKLAEIDILEEMTQLGDLESWSNVTIQEQLDTQKYIAVIFNTRDANLSSKNVRQALSYTLPHKPNDDTRALGPLSPKSWAYNPKVKPYDYSVESAQNLLTDYQTDIELELTTTPTYAQMAEEIKKSWEQLGFSIKLKVVNFPDVSNYQILLAGQQIPNDPDQYLLWHSTQGTNISGYQNAKVDKLLEDGRKETDQKKRREAYIDFQRFLVEDSPVAFIKHLQSFTITRNSII